MVLLFQNISHVNKVYDLFVVGSPPKYFSKYSFFLVLFSVFARSDVLLAIRVKASGLKY